MRGRVLPLCTERSPTTAPPTSAVVPVSTTKLKADSIAVSLLSNAVFAGSLPAHGGGCL